MLPNSRPICFLLSGLMRSPFPTTSDARTKRTVPPISVAAIEIWSRSDPPNAAPRMIESWIAPTIKPPPLSGSSLMPFASQADHATGIAEFSAPHAIMRAATPHRECPSANRHSVTASDQNPPIVMPRRLEPPSRSQSSAPRQSGATMLASARSAPAAHGGGRGGLRWLR
jgi:hypothetical protein